MTCFPLTLRLLSVALTALLSGVVFAAPAPLPPTAAASTAGLTPVEFTFTVPRLSPAENRFARELWADVTTPSGRVLRLPAFFVGQNTYAVRARPDETGTYQLGALLESTAGQPPAALASAHVSSPRAITIAPDQRARLPSIRVDTTSRFGFRRSDGPAFFPVGTNLAWAMRPDVGSYYREAFQAFAAADLNWMRVWMAHWGQLNLDWPAQADAPRLPPAQLDLAVAARWDELLAAANAHGVYVQLVLQHHGQYSTTVNSNWTAHPWNVANGGFLKKPADFFTDAEALRRTRLKYRYIVARYGWSPAIFAWELFNEVHWVDALKLDHHEAAVAHWHDEMAAHLRALDVYQHPITTSTEDLRSPIYASMDFLQPHLYAANLVAGARTFAPTLLDEKRPIFYGEFGADHLPVADEVKKSTLTEAPPAWASLMGTGRIPAAPWEGWKLLAAGRLGEIGALHRFVVQSGWARQRDLQPFSAAVETTARQPRTLPAGQHWQRRPSPDLILPDDGREPLALADWPAALVAPGAPSEHADPLAFPSRATVRTTFTEPTTVRLHIAEVSEKGGTLRARLADRNVSVEKTWRSPRNVPDELTLSVPAGEHTLVLENTGAADWVRLSKIDLGRDAPALAAIGQRNAHFVALWVRHIPNLFALQPGPAADGTLVVEDLPAGRWAITWWDTATGATDNRSTTIDHAGGELRVATPKIERHKTVTLIRQP